MHLVLLVSFFLIISFQHVSDYKREFKKKKERLQICKSLHVLAACYQCEE